MLDYQQEQQMKVFLDAISPRENLDQARDEKGRFVEEQTETVKLDYDKVYWKPINDHTFVRRRKSYYVLIDSAVLLGVLVVISIIM